MDRLLALLLGIRYRQIVTLRLVYVVVITLWVLIGVGMAILTMLNRDAVRIVSALGITVCLMTSTFCYTRIFVKLRSQRAQVHSSPPSPPQQDNQTISLNILRYRKTVFTSLWLQMSLVVCFLPYLVLAPFAFHQFEEKHSSTLYTQFYSTVTLLFLNSALNPILYCWKIKEVRRVMMEILHCRKI